MTAQEIASRLTPLARGLLQDWTRHPVGDPREDNAVGTHSIDGVVVEMRRMGLVGASSARHGVRTVRATALGREVAALATPTP